MRPPSTRQRECGAADQDGDGVARGWRSTARDRTITDVETLGRPQWKRASGYHRQARVENAFSRYKSMLEDGLRARSVSGRDVEASLLHRILNQPTAPGRPESHAIIR